MSPHIASLSLLLIVVTSRLFLQDFFTFYIFYSVMPDVPVEISLHDIIEGKDTIYQRILKDKNSNFSIE